MFGRTLLVLEIVVSLAIASQAATYTETTLYNFGVNAGDGSYPNGIPVRDSQGNLYSVTEHGGEYGYGTVFKFDSNGNESLLHSFNNTDGATPIGSLTMDAAGNLYGTTTAGGLTSTAFPQGMGVVFKITTSGTYSLLYKFGTTSSDGASPFGILTIDSAGNLYGTTSVGGGTCGINGVFGCGTVYKLTSAGVETVLYRFTGQLDGWEPFSNLVRDGSGNLYGTASAGGKNGQGVLFKLTPKNKLSVIYPFCSVSGCTDGASPRNIIRTSAGVFYGATPGGGTSLRGVAFKITSAGVETVLHNFCPGGTSTGCHDGETPNVSLLSGSILYGTTSSGGKDYNDGVAFKLTTGGSYSVIFNFNNNFNTGNDANGVTMDSAGNLYGTALNGGAEAGTLFELKKN